MDAWLDELLERHRSSLRDAVLTEARLARVQAEAKAEAHKSLLRVAAILDAARFGQSNV